MTTHFINNQRVAGSTGDTIPVLDPSDGQVFAHLARGNAEDIRKAVAAARKAADGGAWSQLAPVERGRLLHKLSDAIPCPSRPVVAAGNARLRQASQAGKA